MLSDDQVFAKVIFDQEFDELFHNANLGIFNFIEWEEKSNLIPYINCTNRDGVTLLYLACNEGREDVVEYLLSIKELDVNLKEGMNEKRYSFHKRIYVFESGTPLYISCKNGNTKIVKLLLSRSDLNVNKGYVYTTEYTQDKSFDQSPLYIAIQEGHFEIAKLLIEQLNIDPYYGKCCEGHSMSCLGKSIYMKEWNLCYLILKKMKEMKIRIDYDYRSIYISDILLTCQSENIEFLKELLKANIYTIDNCFPLHYAIFIKNHEMASLLRRYGANLYLEGDTISHIVWALRNFIDDYRFEKFSSVEYEKPIELAEKYQIDLFYCKTLDEILRKRLCKSYVDIIVKFDE